MAKFELYASKTALKKHEKGEGSKMQKMEDKKGIKNIVKKTSKKSGTHLMDGKMMKNSAMKKAAPKKMGKKK